MQATNRRVVLVGIVFFMVCCMPLEVIGDRQKHWLSESMQIAGGYVKRAQAKVSEIGGKFFIFGGIWGELFPSAPGGFFVCAESPVRGCELVMKGCDEASCSSSARWRLERTNAVLVTLPSLIQQPQKWTAWRCSTRRRLPLPICTGVLLEKHLHPDMSTA
eukprot:1852404-Rhodomonas_salina.2